MMAQVHNTGFFGNVSPKLLKPIIFSEVFQKYSNIYICSFEQKAFGMAEKCLRVPKSLLRDTLFKHLYFSRAN